jgi:glycosyltransferase involved in cell wall biosynthesis
MNRQGWKAGEPFTLSGTDLKMVKKASPATPSKKSAALISVVFSFRNEEDVLPELIARTTAMFDAEKLTYELIFVNDASTDRSLDILSQQSAANPAIKVVNMSRRFGVSECVLAGMRYAAGDAIIYMDADLQDPPETIPEMVAKWRDGADVVYTVRSGREGENASKMVLTKLAYRMIDAISEIELPQNAGDFRLIDRQVCEKLLELPETDPYLRGLVRWLGFRQEEVRYLRQSRAAGETHFPLLGSISPVKQFMLGLTSFSTMPVFVILVIGLVATLAGIGGLLVSCFLALAGFETGVWTWLFLAVSAWGSVMAAIGTVGIYVVRVYKDVRGRPRYIVRDTLGFDGDR